MQTTRKAIIAALAAAFSFAMTSLVSFAGSEFEGVWKVKDSAGQPFEITLSSDGGAKGSRAEGMTGSWTEEGKSAVIRWNTGWVTKIIKEGDRYKKIAFEKGKPLDGPPSNSSDAEKIK